MMSNFLLNVNLEASIGSGEDCHLILHDNDNDQKPCVIGVFDGLGGRSAGFDGLKGGQIASKEASQVSQKVLRQWNGDLTEGIAHEIQSTICQHLKSQADAKMPKSRLSGTLTGKRLCTTIALASIREREEGVYGINLAWMGDSRIYFLSPSQGLQQLTVDDLEVKKDAFEMIREDPPMSQYLTADIPSNWRIHYSFETIEEQGFILACTDGCFQYLSTPWDFEKLLIEALMNVTSPAEWETLLVEKYNEIKQDDVSLILRSFGFTDFEHIQNSYRSRHETLVSTYNNIASDIETLRKLWETYRINYESRLKVNIVTVEEKEISEPQVKSSLSYPRDEPLEISENRPQNQKMETADKHLLTEQREREKAKVRSPELPSLLDQKSLTHEQKLTDRKSQVDSLTTKAVRYRSLSSSNAIEIYYQILDIDPENIESLFALGEMYLDNRQYSGAIEYLRKVLDLLGENDHKYLRDSMKYLAKAYYQSHQDKQAVELFVQLYPDLDDLHMEMYVESLISESRFEEAKSVCKVVREKNPYTPFALRWIGHILYRQNSLEDAKKYLKHAVELYRNIYNNITIPDNLRTLQEVEEEYKKVCKKQN
jgi:serine/threonine protein phosphatase PrpC